MTFDQLCKQFANGPVHDVLFDRGLAEYCKANGVSQLSTLWRVYIHARRKLFNTSKSSTH